MTWRENNQDLKQSEAYRPRGVGDLLDQSLSLLRRRFVHIFAISVALQLIQYILGLWSGNGATPSAQIAAIANNLTDLSQVSEGSSSLLALFSLLSSQFLGAAAVIFVAADLEHKKSDLPQVLKALVEVLPKLLWTLLVLGALGGLGFILIIVVSSLIGAFAAALGGMFSAVMIGLVAFIDLAVATTFFLYIALSPIVVVVEKVSGMRAIRRSAKLISTRNGPGYKNNNVSRMAVIYLIVMLSSWGVAALFSLPAVIIQFFLQDAASLFGSGLVAGLISMLSQILEVLGQAAFMPFGELAMAYFYFDLRARHEGLDLLLTTRRLNNKAQQSAQAIEGSAL